MFLNIKNLFNSNYQADYKGLDLDRIVGGTQLYPIDKNECYLYYEGAVPTHSDLVEITELDYNMEHERINRMPKPLTDTDRIAALEETIFDAMMGGKL